MSSMSIGFRVLGARALSAIGFERVARTHIDEVLASAPSHRSALFHKARLALNAGERQAAEHTLRELVAIDPKFSDALEALAKLSFPGPDYRQALAAVHDQLRPKTYLEIGVRFAETLRLAHAAERAVGIDPRPKPKRALKSNTRLFAELSDDFFAQHTLEEVFGGQRVDLAFIDGMHLFEYVLRDFANVERWCHRGSTIVLHDCLPVAPITAARDRATRFWVGDTWKALECLLAHRKDLTIRVIPAYPSGLVLIQKLDPESTVLRDSHDELTRQYVDAPYPYLPGRWPDHFPMLENTTAALTAFLTRSAPR